MDIEQGEECTEHAEGASGTLQVSPLPDPAAPQTPAAYDAVWSEWKRLRQQKSYAVVLRRYREYVPA